jgi:hypothetical protein
MNWILVLKLDVRSSCFWIFSWKLRFNCGRIKNGPLLIWPEKKKEINASGLEQTERSNFYFYVQHMPKIVLAFRTPLGRSKSKMPPALLSLPGHCCSNHIRDSWSIFLCRLSSEIRMRPVVPAMVAKSHFVNLTRPRRRFISTRVGIVPADLQHVRIGFHQNVKCIPAR